VPCVLLADQKFQVPEGNYLLLNLEKVICLDELEPWPENDAHKLLLVYIVKLKSVQ
jgi:hypothetical protein